jgi:hypothetical protein
MSAQMWTPAEEALLASLVGHMTYAEIGAHLGRTCSSVKIHARRLGHRRVVIAPMPQRFWEKVNRDGPVPEHCPELGPCWLWEGSIHPAGYGRFALGGRIVKAHRVAYELANGAVPGEAVVRHRCDVKRCVRPSHLCLGSQEDNVRDAMERGLLPRGASHTHAKLSMADVTAIRAADPKATHISLSRQYGVSHQVIGRVRRGESYGGLHGE